MQKACWKLDANDEARYIDIQTDDDSDSGCSLNGNESVGDVDVNNNERHQSKQMHTAQWSNLPDILLEDIYRRLTCRERYYASLVCRNWYRAFHLPLVWESFLVDDRTLTRSKFNYYSGWTYVLDHLRTQMCLTRIGRYIRGLEFRPQYSFNNLFQFMSLIAWCMEQNKKEKKPSDFVGVGMNIKHLKYVFPCNMAAPDDPEGVKLFGTGGQMLAALKRLMANLDKLKTVELIDLMLDRYEAKHLLDEVVNTCSLRRLHLVNVTTAHCPIMHVGLFFNLQILVISPQNIDDDILMLLADSRLQHLHLLQNRYTPASVQLSPCSAKAWRIVKRDNPGLKVHLRVESAIGDNEILMQPDAPVYSILYETPKTQISPSTLLRTVDMYKRTLHIYGHEIMLPRFVSPKQFQQRIDSLIMLMVRQCYNLTSLVIRENVSTSTLLLIARTAGNLRQFIVRRNSIKLKCDWPKNPDWSDEFYEWLRTVSKCYEQTEKEISQILGCRWKMLTDQEFKHTCVNVQHEFYDYYSPV